MGHIIDSSTDDTPDEGGAYTMRSQSGRVWRMGPTSSDGRPVTFDDARRTAAALGFELLDEAGAR